ncbi:sensor histidine kinase [Ferruginibacter sp. HRS2-29]|uniref:sensor histidine kinase n=1 Tax=Ferruginibacter sp. HRS2-29 TaxID=2487334 RepID=UPI0020CFAAA5|nr:ATP-binding protein [Ferruginibacter sp. HRS2-29]
MHRIYFVTLQAGTNSFPSYVAGAGILVLAFSLFVIIQAVYSRMKKNRLLAANQQLSQNFEKELMQTRIDVQSATLERIANELHDNVGQLLSTSKMFLGVAERAVATPVPAIAAAGEAISKAMVEIRNMAKFLDPDWLSQFDLYQELATETDRINAAGELSIILRRTSHSLPIVPAQQFILYRVMQEAIQNVLKHAKAKKLLIHIKYNERIIHLRLNDDGIGFNTHAHSKGLGLGIMRHRMQTLGGNISIRSDSEGTSIQLILPIKQLLP